MRDDLADPITLDLTPRPAGRPHPARVLLPVAGAILVAAGLVAGARTGLFDHVPLLHPGVAAAIEVAGAAVLVASWWRTGRHPMRLILPLALLAVAIVVGVIALLLRVTGTVNDPYPPIFALYLFTAIAAIVTLPLTLVTRGRSWWRTTVAATAVPLTLAGAFLLIDIQYGIWPTVGDVLGHAGVLSGATAEQVLNTRPGQGAPATGVTVQLDAPATRSGFVHRPGVVFLPPAYFGPDRADLPVLLMLVGTPGTPVNWLTAGGARAADNAYAAAHGGVAPVLIIADQNGSHTADTECVNGPQGQSETYLTQDVPAFITGTLRITHQASRWAVVGFSEGGTCALDLVLGHPDVYAHLVDLGGDPTPTLGDPQNTLSALFGGSTLAQHAHNPAHLMAIHRYPGVTAWFAAGVDDPARVRTAQRMATDATHAGMVTHEFTGISGHSWQFAADAFTRILPGLCTELGLHHPPTGTTGHRSPRPTVEAARAATATRHRKRSPTGRAPH